MYHAYQKKQVFCQQVVKSCFTPYILVNWTLVTAVVVPDASVTCTAGLVGPSACRDGKPAGASQCTLFTSVSRQDNLTCSANTQLLHQVNERSTVEFA